MAGLQRQASLRVAGNKDYLLKSSHILALLESRFAPALPYIRLNTPVTDITYDGPRVALTTASNEIVEADQVIVTVPHRVLYDQLITFSPALPASHQNAINRIRTDKGLKIVLQFASRFWPADATTIFGEGYIPEFFAAGWGGRSASNRILSAWVNGDNAEFLSTLSEAEMIALVLGELDALFEGAATPAYNSHFIADWGAEPWIRGSISHEPPGAGNAREILATSIAGKIHFAGEASHYLGHAGTVNGAMETALRAITHILQS
jgi:monoamine oxidase